MQTAVPANLPRRGIAYDPERLSVGYLTPRQRRRALKKERRAFPLLLDIDNDPYDGDDEDDRCTCCDGDIWVECDDPIQCSTRAVTASGTRQRLPGHRLGTEPGDLLTRTGRTPLVDELTPYLDWPVTFKDGAIFCENGRACRIPPVMATAQPGSAWCTCWTRASCWDGSRSTPRATGAMPKAGQAHRNWPRTWRKLGFKACTCTWSASRAARVAAVPPPGETARAATNDRRFTGLDDHAAHLRVVSRSSASSRVAAP